MIKTSEYAIEEEKKRKKKTIGMISRKEGLYWEKAQKKASSFYPHRVKSGCKYNVHPKNIYFSKLRTVPPHNNACWKVVVSDI